MVKIDTRMEYERRSSPTGRDVLIVVAQVASGMMTEGS